MATRTVRTTIDPSMELEVDQAEYARLAELRVLLPAGVPVRVASHRVDGGPGKALAARAHVGGPMKATLPTHTIQTTFRPDLTITVNDDEYQDLLARGLVYSGSPQSPAADFYDNLFASKVSGGTATPAALRAAFGLVFKADAATYGTNTTAATTHIQGLIDAAVAAGGGTVYIPPGGYKMTGQLILPKTRVDSTDPQVNLIGGGRQASKLIWATDLGAGKFGITFADRATDGSSMSLGLIADLYLQGPALTNTIGVAPAVMSGIGNTARREIRGARITGFYAGLCMTGDHTQFEHVNCGGNYYGLYLDVGNPALYGSWKFIDCQFNGNYAAGVAVSPNASLHGGYFQGCWMGYQPYGLLKEAGAGSNANFVIQTTFAQCGFELEGNGLAYDASGAAQFLENHFDHCYSSNDGSFNWAAKPNNALFDLNLVSQLRITAPQGGWAPRATAIFKANSFSQSVIEDPNGNMCAAVNAAGKVFASGGGDDLVRIVAPGYFAGKLMSLRDGVINVGDALAVLGAQVRQATAAGVPAGVAMTGTSTLNTRIVVATEGRVTVNKEPAYTGQEGYLKASATAGKLGLAASWDPAIFGLAQAPTDNTANTTQIVLRPSTIPAAVFADVDLGFGGDGGAISQTIGSGGFNTVALDHVTTDTVSAFNTTTHLFTVPADGLYEMSVKIRVTDGTAGGPQLGIGVHTSNIDGAWFKWSYLQSEGTAGNMRQTFDYFRAAKFVAGDQLRLYVFVSTATNLAQANLTIRKVG